MVNNSSQTQICDETGFTYTKVNRCIAEGRRSFLDRVAGIESGAECSRLAPLLSRLVDGEASAEDMALLRPHLRGCLACRATLRNFREVPARAAAFAPLLVAPGVLRRVGRWLSHLGFTKTATVIAVAGSLVGGGTAIVHGIGNGPAPVPHPRSQALPRPRPVAHIAHARPRHPVVHRKHPAAKQPGPVTSAPSSPPPATGPAPAAAPKPAPAHTGASGSEFGP